MIRIEKTKSKCLLIREPVINSMNGLTKIFFFVLLCFFLFGCSSSTEKLQKINIALHDAVSLSIEGSTNTIVLPFPEGYSEICFIDWTLKNNKTDNTILKNKVVPETYGRNVFIIPNDIDKRIAQNQKNLDTGQLTSPFRNNEFFYLDNIKVDNGYKCISASLQNLTGHNILGFKTNSALAVLVTIKSLNGTIVIS